MLAGIIVGAAAVVAALMLFQIRQSANQNDGYATRFSAIAILIAGVVVAVVIETHSGAEASDEKRGLAGVPLDQLARVASGFDNGAPAVDPVRTDAGKVASVPSLISGLEQRLEANPDDAGGWALLAQSYAFLGEVDAAETALGRAVDLGIDEAGLRDRVASARRDPHAGVPGSPALD